MEIEIQRRVMEHMPKEAFEAMLDRLRPEQEERRQRTEKLLSMSVTELKAHLDVTLKQELIHQIESMPNRVKEHLDNVVMRAIGSAVGLVPDRYSSGTWDVARGGLTGLGKDIQARATKEIELAIPDYVSAVAVSPVATAAFIEEVRSQYARALKEQLREQVRKLATEKVKADADRLVAEILKDAP